MAEGDNLPMLTLRCIVPKVESEWNREKDGSDATVKLTEFYLPVTSAQAEIVTRLMLEINANAIPCDIE